MSMDKNAVAAGFALPKAPSRTPVAVDAADRFVGEKPSKQTKRKETAGEHLTVYVPAELAEVLRVACAKERRSLSAAVTEALGMWTNGRMNK